MANNGKRILVTGGGGQLAQCLKNQLPKNIADEYLFVNRHTLDITQAGAIEKLFAEFSPQIVVNTAAYTNVDRAEEERDLAFSINGEGVKLLAQACKDHGALLIHISTDYVFDGKGATPYKEEHITNPQTVYGASKKVGEDAVIEIGLNQFYIIRTSWLYSEYGNNFYKTMQRLASEKDMLQVVNDQKGCPTNANDLAKGILKIIETYKGYSTKKAANGIYHFSNAGNTTWFGFALEIFRLKDINIKVIPVSSATFPTRAKRPSYSVFDVNKFSKIFDFQIPEWKKSLSDLIDKNRKV